MSKPEPDVYLEPSQENGAAFLSRNEHTLPFLKASGGEVLYVGSGGDFLIGPAGRGWDMAMLVKQSSVESFMEFASNHEYLAGIGHRVAAVRDSRILPLVDALAKAPE